MFYRLKNVSFQKDNKFARTKYCCLLLKNLTDILFNINVNPGIGTYSNHKYWNK